MLAIACFCCMPINLAFVRNLSDCQGASPILITLGTGTFLPDSLTLYQMLGVLMISTAILAYGFAQFRKTTINSKGIILALITSCFIAAYTIIDGTGTRAAQNAMTYFGIMSICSSVVLISIFSVFTMVLSNGYLPKAGGFVLSAGQPLLSPMPLCCGLVCQRQSRWCHPCVKHLFCLPLGLAQSVWVNV